MELPHRAVLEARRREIQAFCVSADPESERYVREIFGAGNYLILHDVRRLPEKLPEIYCRIAV